MAYSILALAAAAHVAASHAPATWAPLHDATPQAAQRQAEVQGIAQGQQALAGGGVMPVQNSPSGVLQVAAPVTGNATLRIGTEIPLRLEEDLTTKGKQLRVGQRFHLTSSEPVLMNGVTVIPVGTPAEGEITDVRNKGMWGKSGHLSARVLYMTVNGRQIRLSGTFDEKGSAGGVGAVAVSAFVFLPAGFFMTGTSAHVPAGTVVKSFVDEDVPLAMPAVAEAPLQVGAPAAPMQVPAQPH